MKHPCVALTLCGALLATAVGSQVPPTAGAPAPSAPAATPSPPRPLTPEEERLRAAFMLAGAGDFAGAIAALEATQRQGVATPPELSLLGALYLESDRARDALRVLQPLAAGEDADPAVLYNLGRSSLALDMGAEAHSYLERAVAKAPLSPAGRELGLLLAQQGDVVGAYRLLRPWSLRAGDDVEAVVTAASLALRLERPAEAEQVLVALPAEDPAARLLRGRARVQSEDAAGALAQLEPLLASHPPGLELEIVTAVAEARLLAGDARGARELLAGKPAGQPGVAVLLARAQRLAGDSAGARATLAPFVERLPDQPSAVGDPRLPAGVAAEYGHALLASGDVAGAARYLEIATRLHPSGRAGWEGLAAAHTTAGRREQAAAAQGKVEELRRAEAARRNATPPAPAVAAAGTPLRPGLLEARQLLQGGKGEEALARVRSEVAAAPSDPEGRVLEAQVLLRLGRWEESLRAAEAALALQPANPNLVYLRSAVLIALQRLPEAEQGLRAVLATAPDHVGALNDLAVVLVGQQKLDEARRLLERVLQLKPGDPLARASLEQVEALAARRPN